METPIRKSWFRKKLVPGIPYLWLALFFLLPFVIVAKISFSHYVGAQPPYAPVWEWNNISGFFAGLDLENFRTLLGGGHIYVDAFLSLLSIDGLRSAVRLDVTSLILVLIGFSLPFLVEKAQKKWWLALLAIIALLFARSYFGQVYALLPDSLYIDAFLSSVRIAAVSTILLLIVGFPIAYAMAKAPKSWQPMLLALVILPFLTSFLIRIYAWIGILKPEGLLSQLFLKLGLISQPLDILGTETAIFIGIVYAYLPFMVLPLYATLEKMDYSLLEAALDLGCPPWRAFWQVTVPLAKPAIFSGSLLCFIPVVGEFVIPDLLGGSETLMIGKVLWSEFFSNRDWPLASSVAIVLLFCLVVPITIYQYIETRRSEEERK